MPSGESDWVTVTSAQGSKMCVRLKQTNKKGVGLEVCHKWWWCDSSVEKKKIKWNSL